MKTWKNKALALALIVGGIISAIPDGDGTFLVFALIIGIPIFFCKRSVISEDNADYIIEDGKIYEIKNGKKLLVEYEADENERSKK